tara:strand:- start:156 stop:269 length:114 start_codon:yes stop_codon:yes gene_type:complete
MGEEILSGVNYSDKTLVINGFIISNYNIEAFYLLSNI